MFRRETIEARIRALENELKELKSKLIQDSVHPRTVMVPENVEGIFAEIERKVAEYFTDFHYDPESGEITVFGERYVLFRSASVSHEFIQFVRERYASYPANEALSIGNNFLYDNAKVIGKKDAIAFHKRLNLQEPIEKLSAGPVHFAFTGWANVEIFPDSRPVTDESFLLKFQHHNSFEAQSWIKAGTKSEIPVCTMNCGYSAGWCEESFGMSLTTVEVSCEAKGDNECIFVMAPTDKIEQYVEELTDLSEVENFEIPVFFKRIHAEEKLKESLDQKEILIQEIHHRVKNNLQVITSLLRLQMDNLSDVRLQHEFAASINRITTMATVHELMYRTKGFDRMSMLTYFKELSKSLVQLYTLDDSVELDVRVEIRDRTFDLESSIPMALIMNEITCNAFKHALNNGGKFYLYLCERGDQLELTIGDNGGGYETKETSDGLGLSLVQILCDQLNAHVDIQNSQEGLEYKITFRLPE